MKKAVWGGLVLVLFLFSTPAFAQLGTVAKVRDKYPTPLGARHAAFLIEVACATGKGLLRKDAGTNILLPDGTRVSQDIVMERDGSHHYDILSDGEGAASPTWGDVGPIDASRYYAVTCGDVEVIPPPPGNAVSRAEVQVLLEQLRIDLQNELRAQVDQLLAIDNDFRLSITELLDRPVATEAIIQGYIDAALQSLVVEGSTSRAFGHGHRVQLPVVRKPR